MRIIFVRHGHPNYQLDCLTELGKLQAEACGERLKSEPISKVFTSTLGRAVETGEAIAKRHGLDITKLEFMREVRWGSRDGSELYKGGHPWEVGDLISEKGDSLTRKNWGESKYFSNNAVVDAYKTVTEGFDNWIKTLGYERRGCYYRATEHNEDTIVLASHGGSSNIVLSHLLNIPLPLLCSFLRPQFTSITIINFYRADGKRFQPRLEMMNDYLHITGIDAENIIAN